MSKQLVLINSEKLRAEHLKKCKDAQKQLEKNQQILSDYRDVHQPAFISWVSAEFGDLLSVVRELTQKVMYYEKLVREVEQVRYARRISYRLAYQIVLEERENLESGSSHFDDDEDDFSDDGEDEESHSFYEPKSAPKRKVDGATTENKELKSLFRDFAKQLHPDVNPNQSSKDKDLWHQVLVAYEQGDLTRLQSLQTFKHTKQRSEDGTLGIGDLQKIYRQVMRNIQAVQKEIREFKTSVDWNFKEKLKSGKGLGTLKKEMKVEMLSEKHLLEGVVREAEALVERWVKPAKKGKKQKR